MTGECCQTGEEPEPCAPQEQQEPPVCSETAACEETPPCCTRRKCRIARICTCLGMCPRPPIPTVCCSRFAILPKGKKDYIRDNAVNAIRQVPRKPAMKYIDDRKGTSHQWCTSGYPRRFVLEENFGKVPPYIECYKQEQYVQDQMSKHEMQSKEREMGEQCRHLDQDERAAILCGLKKNWEEVFGEYQALPLLIDTPGKIAKKSELEKKLKEIEKDIQLVERHDHVFVADTGRSFYLS
jgi:hypothetical protein